MGFNRFQVELLIWVLHVVLVVGFEKCKIKGREGDLALELLCRESEMLESRQHLLVVFCPVGAMGRRASTPGGFAFATEPAQIRRIAEGGRGDRHCVSQANCVPARNGEQTSMSDDEMTCKLHPNLLR